MDTPHFLDLQQVLRLHRSLIDWYGGANGLRDAGPLHSAIAMPRSSFGGNFLHEDVYETVAAYPFHLVPNHPFIDGNKRIGAACAIVFLDLNGIQIEPDENALVEMTLAVARGELMKPGIAAWFRQRTCV